MPRSRHRVTIPSLGSFGLTDRIDILPDFSGRCPIMDPGAGHLFKSLGCAAENLVHTAVAQGFASDVEFDPARETVLIHLDRDTPIRPTELYRAITQRQCVRAAYNGRPVELWELNQLEDAGTGRGVRTILWCLTVPRSRSTVCDAGETSHN